MLNSSNIKKFKWHRLMRWMVPQLSNQKHMQSKKGQKLQYAKKPKSKIYIGTGKHDTEVTASEKSYCLKDFFVTLLWTIKRNNTAHILCLVKFVPLQKHQCPTGTLHLPKSLLSASSLIFFSFGRAIKTDSVVSTPNIPLIHNSTQE